MVTCPLCGRQFHKDELKTGKLRCPACKQLLQWEKLPARRRVLIVLASVILGCLVPYSAGARGEALFWYGVLLPVPIAYAWIFVSGFLSPRLVKAEDNDGFPHITPPPNSTGSSGSSSGL